jgi:RimJ/RimL family protein N-acetyltransferase
MSVKKQEPEVSVVRVETDELKNEAYRLRYSVFSIEMGDHRYADHTKQIWSDPDDFAASNLFAAIDEHNQVVGTIRLTAYREHKFIAADQYHFDVLAGMLKLPVDNLLQRVARADRGVLAQSVRGTSVLNKLQDSMESYAVEKGLDVLVGVPGVGNERSRNAFRKLGWRETELTGEHKGYKCHIIYKLLEGVAGA